MLWNQQDPFDLPTRGELARRAHSAWLTWALSSDARLPRIPRQAVRDGGYKTLVETPRGRRVCDRWWRRALATLERLTPPSLR